ALILFLSVDGSARAESNDQEVKALKAQVEQLTRTVNKLLEAQAQNAADAKAAKKQASQAEAQAAQAKATAADAHAKSSQVPVKAGVLGYRQLQRPQVPRTQAWQRSHVLYALRRDHALRTTGRFVRRGDEECQVGASCPRRYHADRKFRLDA